ncbi:uncharacterized protein LOC126837352 [Adelges cooleyi]|uniref:uncharacterized protein LOC126837352 n=1 Tax=Adelges cooleyi TaxID=133065 RepID=UPI0021805376|nr:uncharacterized protein LOC126837352 [Adelges cooleyi]
MHLKNILLLFCVALYFLQCQGALPSYEERAIIFDIVKKYEKPDGIDIEGDGVRTINFEGVKDIIKEVLPKLHKHKELTSLSKLEMIGSSYKYTLEQVQTFAKEYLQLKELGPVIENTLKELFYQYKFGHRIKFHDLKHLLGLLRSGKVVEEHPDAEFPYLKYPKTAVPYKLENSVYKFTIKEVESIVIQHLYHGSFI